MTRRPPQYPAQSSPWRGSWGVHSPSCHALGTRPRAPGSPDLRGQAQEAWAGPSVTGQSLVVSRLPRCPWAFLGQELGNRATPPRTASSTACRVQARQGPGPAPCNASRSSAGGPSGTARGPQGSQAAFKPQTLGRGPLPPQRSPRYVPASPLPCVQVSTLGGPRARGPPVEEEADRVGNRP